MRILNTTLPKLCFASPGDVVRLLDDCGNEQPEPFLVCVVNSGAKPMPRHASNGLYSEDRPLFLVSIATGATRAMPHLSKRVRILRDAAIITGDDE
jgi:hypothetical protein